MKKILIQLLFVIGFNSSLYSDVIHRDINIPILMGDIMIIIPHTVSLEDRDGDGVEDTVDTPTANAQNISFNANGSGHNIVITGSDNDSPITFTIITQPTHGILSGTAPNLSYIPNDGYEGEDSFTFMVSDGIHNSTVVKVNISIVVDYPSMETDADTYTPNDIVNVSVEGTLSGDQDWAGIYLVGTQSNWANVIAWNWIPSNGTFALSEIMKSMPAGAYEARLFFHNSFNIESNSSFTVADTADGYADFGSYVPQLYSNNEAGDKVADDIYNVYYPETGLSADMPVVMFLKGGGATTIENYSGIMKFMASKGYYVIGVDTNSYQSSYITQKLEIALNESKTRDGLNVSKLVIMGHSLGGGQAFYAMKKFRDDGYGNDGSLALSIDGWFSFNMNEIDLNQLDSNVSFLQMNGLQGTGTDPRIHLKIWNLATQADKSFYTLPSTNHSYVAGDLENVLEKQDLLFSIAALTDDTFSGVTHGAEAIPDTNKASYSDIFNALGAEDTYNSGDCKGEQFNAINVIKNNDIDYCNLSIDAKKYPTTTTLEARATDNTVIRPTIGVPTVDPIYKTHITMVDKSDTKLSSYPKVQNWNSNMTLIRLGNRMYNAATLTETNMTKTKTGTQAYNTLCSRSSDYFRWSNIDSDTFFVVNSSYEFIEAKISGNSVDCSTILDPFVDYEVVHMGPHEGNIDYNDKYVVFVAKKPNDTTFYVILYDIQSKTRVWTKTMPTQVWESNNGTWTPSTLDWISLSSSGKYIVFNNDNGSRDGMYRYDINFENKVKLQYRWDGNGEIYSEGGHGDLGYDTDGNEVFVQFISGVGVYSFNLDNPTQLGKELLHSPYGGGHISCRNSRRRGWCYVTTVGDNYRRVFALKIDGTGDENVQNFSQSHIDNPYHTTYGGASPDGTKMIFNTHWGLGLDDTFVVEAQ
jgi:pimeloyl-ACP methyl ester carboxylesterase